MQKGFEVNIGAGVKQASANWSPIDVNSTMSGAVNLGIREKTRKALPLYEIAQNSGVLPRGQQFHVGMEIEYKEFNDEIEVHPRGVNSRPKIQTMGFERKKCRIGEEAEYMFKLSPHDVRVLESGQMGFGYNDLVNRFRESGGRAVTKYAFRNIVIDMLESVSCDNFGPMAGKMHHNINTGGFIGDAKPIVLNESTVDQAPSIIAALADQAGVGSSEAGSIGLLGGSQITMFADSRYRQMIQRSDYVKDLLAGGCPDACRLRGMGYNGEAMSGVAVNITDALPKPKSRDGKQWGYIIGIVHGACVFEGFNETFRLFHGGHTCPDDVFGYGTYAFGHLLLERAAIFVLCVDYQSGSVFSSGLLADTE